MASAKRLLAAFWRFGGPRLARAAGLVLACALTDGISIALIVPMLGLVLNPGTARSAGLLAGPFRLVGAVTPTPQLAWLLGLFSLLIVMRALLLRARDLALQALQAGFVRQMRLDVIEALAAAPWMAVAGLRHARITHVMSGDIQRIGQGLFMLIQLGTAICVVTVQAGLALYLSPALAGLAFVLFVLAAAIFVPVLRRARELGSYLTRANLALLDTTTQFLGGLKLAVSQNLQGPFVAEFRATLDEVQIQQMANLRQNSGRQALLTTLSGLLGAGLVLIGFGVFHLAAPLLIAILAVIARLSGPIGQIQNSLQQVAFTLPAFEEVLAVTQDLKTAATRRRPPGPAAYPDGDIVFHDVHYRHAGGEDGGGCGVCGLSLTIHAGECLGVRGASGAGKTTFADLLAGLIVPQSGTISAGGQPLETVREGVWREHLSYVGQDTFLFHDTIRRNLGWARAGADEAAMWAALDAMGAGDLVRRIGLDAVAGERGALLSGGERQRLALARALLRQPKLLVLDEATAALDVDGEAAVLQRLLALNPRPTIIIIAHRAESLRFCGRVIGFAGGRLTEPAV